VKIASIAGLIALVASSLAIAQNAAQILPRAYVEEALNYMQESALNKHSINWQAVREQTLLRAKDAKTTWDTYPAIAYAITQLGEKHTWFQLPDNLPYDRRQALDAEIKKILARPDPVAPSPFFPSKEIKSHMIHGSRGNFAYVVVPMCVGRFAEWEKKMGLTFSSSPISCTGWCLIYKRRSLRAGSSTFAGIVGAMCGPCSLESALCWVRAISVVSSRLMATIPSRFIRQARLASVRQTAKKTSMRRSSPLRVNSLNCLGSQSCSTAGPQVRVKLWPSPLTGERVSAPSVSTPLASPHQMVCISSRMGPRCFCATRSRLTAPASSIRTD
jgi:hypothetical protein